MTDEYDLSVNGVRIPYTPGGAPPEARQNLLTTLAVVPVPHLRHISRIVVWRPAMPTDGSAPYAGGGSGLGYPRLSVYCFDRRYRPRNWPLNLTLLHEIGHIIDRAYNCTSIMQRNLRQHWQRMADLTPIAPSRRTHGDGEHFADAYQKVLVGRSAPAELRNAMLASPAFLGVTSLPLEQPSALPDPTPGFVGRAMAEMVAQSVAAFAAFERRAANAMDGADVATQPASHADLSAHGAQPITGLPALESFQCADAGNTVIVHSDVVDGMRAAWMQSGESLSVGLLCRTTAPMGCPSPHAGLHAPSGGTGSDAAHFVRLSQGTARAVEIAGLFGIDLQGIARARRPSTSVQQLPMNAPLQNLSFVAIRRGSTREIHVAREAPRKVESWIDGDQWLCLPFIPGIAYRLFKRKFWEASFHRQWGKRSSIDWIAGLANFYRDQTGLEIGVGDISHVLGEDMTDHGSHLVGEDVDCYVLEAPPAGSTFPVAFWCSGTRDSLELREMGAPSATATRPEYSVPSGAAIAEPRRTALRDRYATILAYCVATQGAVEAAVWHGAPALRTRAVDIAQAAWDATVAAGAGTQQSPGWRASWGSGPATRAEIVAPRAGLFIGDGSSNYGDGRGWPPHKDHLHIRLR